MDAWLKAALDYVPRWIDFQVQHFDQPGCSIAIAHRGEVVLEEAFGTADLGSGEVLTPRHRFRVASHSKTFTAAAIPARAAPSPCRDRCTAAEVVRCMMD